MPDPRQFHRRSTSVLSLALVVLGAALLIRTLTAGGGGLARGVVLGLLFVAAGCARLYLQTRGGGKR